VKEISHSNNLNKVYFKSVLKTASSFWSENLYCHSQYCLEFRIQNS